MTIELLSLLCCAHQGQGNASLCSSATKLYARCFQGTTSQHPPGTRSLPNQTQTPPGPDYYNLHERSVTSLTSASKAKATWHNPSYPYTSEATDHLLITPSSLHHWQLPLAATTSTPTASESAFYHPKPPSSNQPKSKPHVASSPFTCHPFPL